MARVFPSFWSTGYPWVCKHLLHLIHGNSRFWSNAQSSLWSGSFTDHTARVVFALLDYLCSECCLFPDVTWCKTEEMVSLWSGSITNVHSLSWCTTLRMLGIWLLHHYFLLVGSSSTHGLIHPKGMFVSILPPMPTSNDGKYLFLFVWLHQMQASALSRGVKYW